MAAVSITRIFNKLKRLIFDQEEEEEEEEDETDKRIKIAAIVATEFMKARHTSFFRKRWDSVNSIVGYT